MNLSSSAAVGFGIAPLLPEVGASATGFAGETLTVEAFFYPEAVAVDIAGSRGGVGAPEHEQARLATAAREGEARAHAVFVSELDRERASLGRTVEEFARQRAAYFQAVEREAVQLTLAIARKILQREAHADPLVLAAMLHVAMAPLQADTAVSLHVHPATAQDWRLYFASRSGATGEFGAQVTVVEDCNVRQGECHLTTSMGTATLSLSQQMETIEESFRDLLDQKPETSI